MLFSLGQKVRVIDSDTTGEVIGIEHSIKIQGGNEVEVKRYQLEIRGQWNAVWYEEHQLVNSIELSSVAEDHIRKLLIDINLKERNFDMVKQLYEEGELHKQKEK